MATIQAQLANALAGRTNVAPVGIQIYVLATAAFVLAITNGLTFGAMTSFDSILLDELDITVSQLKLRDTFLYATSAILAPLAGYLVDKVGVKPALIFGTALMGGLFASYASVDSLMDIYIIHVGMGVALKGCGMMVCVILVSQWFGPGRGRAIGFMVSGSSLGNALLPQLNTALLGYFEWREAFLLIALLPLLLVPLAAFLPKRSPLVDAARSAATDNAAATGDAETTDYWVAVKSRQFWLLGIIAFTTYYSLMGSTTNFILHMQRDLGFPLERADDSLFMLFIVAIITKLAGGYLADRFGPKLVLIGCLAVMLAGAAVLTLVSATTVWLGIGLFGLGWGALYTMIQLMPSRMFGLASLGKILGTLIVFETVAGSLGPFGIGLGYDLTGSYRASFITVVVMLSIALICACLIKAPRLPTSKA